jgi:ABC-type Mn2+/Zn2+ transport system permease subunit/predicted extracellular nuclease
MRLFEFLAYEFVQNAVLAAVLASLLCGLVGTFVVVKRLVFISGGVSHAAFGGLGICHFLGLPPLLGAGAGAVLAAILVSRGDQQGGRTRDAVIGILWAVGMAVGVVFIARTPGYAPNLTSYLFGDILAVSRPMLIATTLLVAAVLLCVLLLFKELVAVAFDEEYARSQGLPVQRLLTLLMVIIALSVVLLIQAVGVILAIALLTIPPTISLSRAHSFRGVIAQATLLGLLMTLGGLALSFAWNLPSGPAIVLLGFAMLLVSSAWRSLARRRTAVVTTVAVLATVVSGCRTIEPPSASFPISAAGADSGRIWELEFLGEAEIPGDPVDGIPVGGLSGLTYDARRRLYYAISDDRSERGPARFYTLKIDLSDGALENADVRVLGWTALTAADGEPFAKGAIDPEGIALTSRDTLIISSEGDARAGLAPFLREFSLEGRQLRDFPLGERYAPRQGQSGVRSNLAMESAGLTADGRTLFTVTENALAQDGPISTSNSPSPGRILEYDLESGRLRAEYLYWIDPVADPPVGDAFSTAGAVEVIAMDERTLLILERSFTVGAGNDIRVFEVDLSAATDIQAFESLESRGLDGIVPAAKRPLLHIDRFGVETDNLEGMAFGPPLPDGSRTLLFVADDNFNPLTQKNQLLAFAARLHPRTIEQIQGAGHWSAYQGHWLRGVEGIVTAVDPDRRSGGFWLQGTPREGNGERAASFGLFVYQPSPMVRPGDRVAVDGIVHELGYPGALPLTRLEASAVEHLASGEPLPEPVILGRDGQEIPRVIDDDGLAEFDPCCDAIDLFESLEGMRVTVNRALVVGGTSRYGEIAVVPDGGESLARQTRRGGALLMPDDSNAQRLLLSDRLAPGAPETMVGDRFRGPVTGVLDYSFGNYKLLVEKWPSSLREQAFEQPSFAAPEPGSLAIASYNVLNLDGLDGSSRFERLAASIVDHLGSPDLLGLQEIQDDNGSGDDGIVSAERTMSRLLEAIVAAGGPRYDYRQVDPQHNADGGEPNGNIRVVWMFDPARVDWVDRGSAGPDDEISVDRSGDGRARLSHSPGRVATSHPAFAGDPDKGWEGGRKCLAGEVVFAGERLFLVNCHLKSKHGDEPPFGSSQPPTLHTEVQRTAQVEQLLTFVEAILAIEPQAGIIVLGDMNEHEFRQPMLELADGALVNLVDREDPSERYSYNYQGNSQLLDHILVSASLAVRVGDVHYVHVNADSADAQRASDHDPVVAFVEF